MLQSAAAAAERVFEFLEEEEEEQTVEHPVSYRSADRRREHLSMCSLAIHPDQIIIQRFLCKGKTGTEGCDRRTDRRRKDDNGQTADAFLRRKQR